MLSVDVISPVSLVPCTGFIKAAEYSDSNEKLKTTPVNNSPKKKGLHDNRNKV